MALEVGKCPTGWREVCHQGVEIRNVDVAVQFEIGSNPIILGRNNFEAIRTSDVIDVVTLTARPTRPGQPK